MNTLRCSTRIVAFGLSTAFGMAGALYANAQSTDSAARDVDTKQPSAQSAEDATSSESLVRAPGTANPMPATRQAEGTAADSSAPGQTPVRGTAASQAPAQATAQGSEQENRAEKQRNAAASDSTAPTTANAVPATRQAEGTAADNTMPGGTPVRGTAATQAPDQPTAQQGSARNDRLRENEARQSSSKQTSASAKSGAGTEATTRLAVAEATARRGSTMIGAVVKDAQGQQAGTVQDIIVDTNSGRVTHAVVAPKDPAESLVAIPWRTVQSMHRGGALIVDRDRLASAPKFDASKWPDLNRAGWSQQADQHWSAPISGMVETNQREHGTHGR